jgi:hypothetical protein
MERKRKRRVEEKREAATDLQENIYNDGKLLKYIFHRQCL